MKERFLKIGQNGNRSRVELESDYGQLCESVCRELHCELFECVPTAKPAGYFILVDEGGRFVADNYPNLIAGYHYGRIADGIVGDALIGKEGYRNGEPDIVGLDEDDFRRLDGALNGVMR